MSRSLPILVATVLVAGAIGAEAHQSTAPSVFRGGAGASAVATNAAVQSDALADKVKAALKANSDLSAFSEALTVTSANSIVTLDGTVPTVQIRARIAELVMKVDGVTKVVNKIKLAKK
jgi:osmotically-inducible protein OsmY